jgi:trans-aconitate 2-methyltransferase
VSGSNFYDDFVEEQARKGVNDRIYALYRKTIHAGLKHDSNILEVGCGIGAMTYLLSKYVTDGIIEAMDSSEKSIQFAQEHCKKPNVHFNTGDAVNYIPLNRDRFDFVLLFDILEHIPPSHHQQLFENASKFMKDEALMLINIPNPLYLEFLHANRPESLQPIDQPIYLNDLVEAVYAAGMIVKSVETHSVSFVDDYQFIVLRKRMKFDEVPLSSLRSFTGKVVNRLKRLCRNLLHRYP